VRQAGLADQHIRIRQAPATPDRRGVGIVVDSTDGRTGCIADGIAAGGERGRSHVVARSMYRFKFDVVWSCYKKEKDMKNVTMSLVVALLVGIGQVANGQEATKPGKEQIARDRLRAAVQEICPVSGNKLGDHGAPIKVAVGKEKEQVFLCCKGCLQGKISPEHWATIHANVAKAQSKCPVMNKALPKNPKWTIVKGQVVFVCCPSCTKKIAADPKTYLQAVDKLYAASLKARRNISR
jgi:hypothetical protein